MDLLTARAVVERARDAAPDRQRVYTGTPEFEVLLAFNPIDAHYLRALSPRRLWVLLAMFTDVSLERVIERPPTRLQWAMFSWHALRYLDAELWNDTKAVRE